MFDEDFMVKSSLSIPQNLPLSYLQWYLPIQREKGEKEESLFCEVCFYKWGLGSLYWGLINLIRFLYTINLSHTPLTS